MSVTINLSDPNGTEMGSLTISDSSLFAGWQDGNYAFHVPIELNWLRVNVTKGFLRVGIIVNGE